RTIGDFVHSSRINANEVALNGRAISAEIKSLYRQTAYDAGATLKLENQVGRNFDQDDRIVLCRQRVRAGPRLGIAIQGHRIRHGGQSRGWTDDVDPRAGNVESDSCFIGRSVGKSNSGAERDRTT